MAKGSNQSTTMTAEKETEQATLPPFYKKPIPLSTEMHAHYSLKETVDYSIAKETNSILLNIVEFAFAAIHYPIVFSGADTVVPLAITGVRNNENLFVSGHGRWLEGTYIPAYVRRYPFVLMEDKEHKQMVLGIDEDTDLLVKSDVRPLFKDGKKTVLTDRALEFCSAFQREFEATKLFTKALEEQGLLVEKQAKIRLANGEEIGLGGFKIIEEAKFNELPEKVFLDWRQKNWLGLVYCHFISLGNWSRLAVLEGERMKAKAN